MPAFSRYSARFFVRNGREDTIPKPIGLGLARSALMLGCSDEFGLHPALFGLVGTESVNFRRFDSREYR